jgi:hypothetical protein
LRQQAPSTSLTLSPMSPCTKACRWITGQRCEILAIASVGQFVEVEDEFVALRQPVENEVCSDEAGAAGYQNHVQTFSEGAVGGK